MFKGFNRKEIINVVIILIIASSIIIYAREGGIVGRTKKNGDGCTCHSEFSSANVSVIISGPDTLISGETATYVVSIVGGPLSAGGTNIAASNGGLFPVAGDLRKESGELTHVAPKFPVAGKVTFEFTYTAPLTLGQETIFANGNSVNLDGANTGDQWNFAENKIINVVQPTEIKDQILINSFELLQNYPNPFNPGTIISWQSSVGSWQTLKVYDVLGNEVTTLVNEWKEAGNHSINFTAEGLSSGIYYYKLIVENFVETKKMILTK